MDLTDIRVWLFGLIIGCPMGKSLENCPADKLRNLPVTDIIKIVENMPEDELNDLISYHKSCLKEREKNKLPN